jgi:hypothetical protein
MGGLDDGGWCIYTISEEEIDEYMLITVPRMT